VTRCDNARGMAREDGLTDGLTEGVTPGTGEFTGWVIARAGGDRDARSYAEGEASGMSCAQRRTPQQGVDGLRGTFDQAERVESFRAAFAPTDVIRYSDLRLELLLLQNRELAQAFVTRELGALSGTTAEAAKMRETLAASFRYGSHVAAAEHLRLHEHTVRNRLQKVEAQVGVAPRDRRTELEVALRLHRLLTAGDPPASG
jgi:sugar diacid utilization regulator